MVVDSGGEGNFSVHSSYRALEKLLLLDEGLNACEELSVW